MSPSSVSDIAAAPAACPAEFDPSFTTLGPEWDELAELIDREVSRRMSHYLSDCDGMEGLTQEVGSGGGDAAAMRWGMMEPVTVHGSAREVQSRYPWEGGVVFMDTNGGGGGATAAAVSPLSDQIMGDIQGGGGEARLEMECLNGSQTRSGEATWGHDGEHTARSWDALLMMEEGICPNTSGLTGRNVFTAYASSVYPPGESMDVERDDSSARRARRHDDTDTDATASMCYSVLTNPSIGDADMTCPASEHGIITLGARVDWSGTEIDANMALAVAGLHEMTLNDEQQQQRESAVSDLSMANAGDTATLFPQLYETQEAILEWRDGMADNLHDNGSETLAGEAPPWPCDDDDSANDADGESLAESEGVPSGCNGAGGFVVFAGRHAGLRRARPLWATESGKRPASTTTVDDGSIAEATEAKKRRL
ncbi:hypothetical protein JDV02_005499 [Purpureocillium takamizusanense]|uniref:Uncharacterized protein n=1 Tax=Purpureocillium takamizusanense TaxID=2060973 RepID=A0A9Q8VBZ3_9HYPO|nr:uncharacterized protein JDV02_005499 [Purpureocillium takamizusanense]UNI19307.1 hypothetical protein JDV02_005499 [Purpureocillium takamizusanense]